MKVKLFRAPYVDDEGASRERICAVLINAPDGVPLEDIENLRDGLENGDRILVFEDEDIEVEWL